MKKLLIVFAALAFIACSDDEKPAEQLVQPQKPLSQDVSSDKFNTQFADLLHSYYNLKDAVIQEDTSAIRKAATILNASNDSLSFKYYKGDATIVETARMFMQNISDELKAMNQEAALNDKRKSFEMIGDNLFTLMQTVGYKKEKVYKQFCPKAFENKGAFWLSSSEEIKNPYLPKQMLKCGEVKETFGGE